ncbi:MAG: hypothetical protein RLZZ15_2846 [Verrucomicrobiota bacterium]|jgi:hypothetical protein
MKRTLRSALGLALLPLLAVARACAATYDVGLPAAPLKKLADVNWAALKPGDIVNIHAKPGGYHEIIQISASGTAAQPILIRGIPDPVTGKLPVIDGDGAVTDPNVNFRNLVFENLGVIIITPRAAGYVYGKTFPSYITIESLDIRNALYDPTGAPHFTDSHGVSRNYHPFACGIYVEFAQHLIVRGCEISFNGNGLFANSKFGAAAASADILIEKNYFHDNGQPTMTGVTNGYGEHHIYVESVGAVYQFNRFGPLRVGCHGTMIKDRSSGTVIRYNTVVTTEGSEVFAILDPQGGVGYIDQQPDYRDAFVYGNSITLQASAGSAASNGVVAFAAYNGANSYAQQHRGTLYFYHNTIVNHRNSACLFSLPDPVYTGGAPVLEKVDARNNVFFTDAAINANLYKTAFIIATKGSPTVDLGLNWISPGTRKDWYGHPSNAIVNGWANLIVGDYAGKNDPGFANLAGGDFHLVNGSDNIDAAGPLAPAALAKGYTVDQEYVVAQSSGPRITLGANPDLGAFETSATYTPPPINHAPVVQPIALNVLGSAPVAFALAATDADNDPLTFAYTTSGIVGTVTGTAPNLTYTPPAAGATGTMIVGYLANDNLANSGAGYVFISSNPAGATPPAVALTIPANLVVNNSAVVALTATANDADGIKKVEFYVGPSLVGTALAAPYTCNWSSATAGRYQVVVKAYDNLNAATYTQPAFVTVQ